MSLFDFQARCHICGEVVDRYTAHDAHAPRCRRPDGVCRCDLYVCPACCPCAAAAPELVGG